LRKGTPALLEDPIPVTLFDFLSEVCRTQPPDQRWLLSPTSFMSSPAKHRARGHLSFCQINPLPILSHLVLRKGHSHPKHSKKAT
jgi:hypothetical protein